jgi:hypothetical protein
MAFLDLVFDRGVLRSIGDRVSHTTLVELARVSPVPRNIAGVAGLVALVLCVLSFLRLPRNAPPQTVPLFRRVAIAAFAGILVSTLVLALLLPAARISPRLVTFGAAAAHVLAVLMASTAARWPGPAGMRVGVVLAAGASFLGLGALVLSLRGVLPGLLGPGEAHSLAASLRHVGEVSYLLVPLAVAVTTIGAVPRGRRRALGFSLAIAAGIATAAALIAGKASLRGDFGIVLYGAQGLDLFIEAAPLVYAPPGGRGALAPHRGWLRPQSAGTASRDGPGRRPPRPS